jgi:hypothetical protein
MLKDKMKRFIINSEKRANNPYEIISDSNGAGIFGGKEYACPSLTKCGSYGGTYDDCPNLARCGTFNYIA